MKFNEIFFASQKTLKIRENFANGNAGYPSVKFSQHMPNSSLNIFFLRISIFIGLWFTLCHVHDL